MLGLALVGAAGLAYCLWPRTAHLRDFDSGEMGRLETTMWRDYYEHRYLALFGSLYQVNRDQYGFSPWDSVRVGFYAARAAKVFQPTSSRAQAQAALPMLEDYYGLIQRRSREPFNVSKAAQMELDWWQLRRENATAAGYGEVIAHVAEEVYGASNANIGEGALVRAEMMHYRDERSDGRMQAEDWEHIRENLVRAYALLKVGVSRSQ